jgi:hypothetical protein
MTSNAAATNHATRVVRYVIPAAITVAGVVVLVVGGVGSIALEASVMLVGAGLSVYLLNWLYRIGASGDHERDREDAARSYFDEHGRWPDEVPDRRSI